VCLYSPKISGGIPRFSVFGSTTESLPANGFFLLPILDCESSAWWMRGEFSQPQITAKTVIFYLARPPSVLAKEAERRKNKIFISGGDGEEISGVSRTPNWGYDGQHRAGSLRRSKQTVRHRGSTTGAQTDDASIMQLCDAHVERLVNGFDFLGDTRSACGWRVVHAYLRFC